MTEQEATAETEAETATPETEAEATDKPDQPKPTETVDFWKSKAREQEKRAKENADKAKKFDEVTEAQKTESQKILERAEAAEHRADALEAAQQRADWIAQVSKKTGVPGDVLRGETLDDIEAHAASVKALLPEPRKAGQVLAEGRTVSAGTGDPAQQFADIIRGARQG